ncbi:guanine nucleotide-binding protein g(o) subunit alpha [Anaeramoeba flamelloides]|uniref:Guanine nucleotide-binding protein g(O) subunit alpha n=1 Tax=Anaeramoeba flamelloides TaxID=1746091 RepID=A0AAV7Y6I8_9EUKA|nr:guanine nucleotide-binding protein g(o) subunit alpha [Anaeramoeba flamelloides]KAJ6231085.1 guanine nucleotide-binding protein g(o) subunit alpha [Anaeramoeba flamelloides]
MGNLCSNKKKEKTNEKIRNNNIGKQLTTEQVQSENEVKLLLLGAGDSGKSTIGKQLRIIHQLDFTKTERMKAIDQIKNNIVHCSRVLIEGLENFGYEFETEKNEALSEEIKICKISEFDDRVEDLISIWNDEGIKKVLNRKNEIQLYDSCEYLFENIKRFTDENYIPTDQDILMTRVRTSGLIETRFNYEQTEFLLFDVGGQRSERKKWIHCFQNVTAIIFVASMSEYDQMLFEDRTKNRMTEALMLFGEICNSRWFTDTAIILFLNKRDLFEKKIQKVDLNICFEDYEGGCNYENGSEFMKNTFISLNNVENRQIYTHYTCATDTNNIKHVFEDVTDFILSNTLRDVGQN